MKTIRRKDYELMTFEKRLVLPCSLVEYHAPYYLLGIIAAFVLYLFLKADQSSFTPLIWVFVGIIGIAAIGIWRRDKRRNFKTISIPLKRKRFKFIMGQLGQSLNWDFENITQDYLIAQSSCSKYGWKRRVTILRTKEAILVNMICLPNNRPFFGNGGIESNYGEILTEKIRALTERNISKELEKLLK